MKSLLYFSLGILITVFVAYSCAEPKAPSNVKATFTEMFPNARDVEWELDDDGMWEAEFEFKGNKLEASFTKSGDWVETKREVEIVSVPVQVLTAIKAKYNDWTIEEVEVFTNTKLKGYEFSLVKGTEKMEVITTIEGEIVNKETEQENDED